MSQRRPRVLIIARGDISRFIKIIKLASTLSDAGYEVIRLGFRVLPKDPAEAADAFGRIVRIPDPTAAAAPQVGTAQPETELSPQRGPRELLKGVLFRFTFGQKLRESVIRRRHAKAPNQFVQRVQQWNVALADAALALSPDLVISSQLDVLQAGHTVSQQLGIPLVYDVRDLSTVAGYGSWSDPQFVKYERAMIRDADLVTTVAPRIADFLRETYDVERPLVLYNCNLKRAQAATEPMRPVRLLFQGFFSPLLNLPELVEAMTLLRGTAVLTLQGDGAVEEELRRLVDELELEDSVKFAPFVPPLDAPLAANDHDVGVNYRRADNLNLRLSLPNKLFDYLGGGLAVLSSDLPSIRDIVEKHDCGVLFEPNGPDAIAAAVLEISSDPDRLARMKRNALEAWEEYSWPRQGAKLVREINKLLPLDAD